MSGVDQDRARGATPEAERPTREALMRAHRAATERRRTVPLGSEEYQRVAAEIARIEIAIAEIEEPSADRFEQRST